MPRIDRERYDTLVHITRQLEKMCGNGNDVLDVAVHALRVARDRERPTLIDNLTDRPTIEKMYPPCADTCPTRGSWGATGIIPPGHMIVQWSNGITAGRYLAHLREH